MRNFINSAKTNSPTGDSGATILPPIGDSFIYMETSSNIHDNIVLCSFEGTDILQITNKTFYHNRVSILTNDSPKSKGCFGIQLFLEVITWSISYNIPKNDLYNISSTDCTLVSLQFTEEKYGIKLTYDQNITPHADMSSCNISITHSVY